MQPATAEPRTPPLPAPRGGLLAWLAFALALGPMWPDFFAHVLREPWAHASLVFAALFAMWTAASPRAAPEALWPRLGGVLTLLAALLALLFVGAALPRWARLAVPLGMIGLALRFGRPPQPVAVLALWILPLPSFLLGLAPGLAEHWRALASSLTGLDASLGLRLHDVDAGMGLAWIGAGLGVHATLRLGSRGLARWTIPLAAAVAAMPFQVVGFAVALGLVADGDAGAVRLALRELPWLVVTAIGLAAPELWRLCAPTPVGPQPRQVEGASG